MTLYEIAVRGRVVDAAGRPLPAEVLDRHLDDVTDELMDLEGADDDLSDADVSAKLEVGEVEVSVVVSAGDPVGAARKGNSAIRSAVHAAGGHTPGWGTSAVELVESWGLEYEASSQRRLETATP